MSANDLAFLIFGFSCGLWCGAWVADHNWREKAKSGFRMASGGSLYRARDWSYKKYGKPIGNDAAQGCWTAMLSARETIK